jgi:DNA-directed RNA polymerase subunit RPC12/RpoP
MMVRCGSCRNQFDVPGPGRFSCPVCGSINMVRAAPGADPGAASAPPPPRPPDPPANRVQCPNCEFRFIVGEIAVAKCPNCGTDVETGSPEQPPPTGQ